MHKILKRTRNFQKISYTFTSQNVFLKKYALPNSFQQL